MCTVVKRNLLTLLATALTVGLVPRLALADPVPLGYLIWDVTDPGVSGEFDIVNQTGANSSGDGTWPVTTDLPFTGLSLTVSFSDGSTSAFGDTYFTLAPDGLSFDGAPIAIGAGVLPTGSMLTGQLGARPSNT